MSHLLRPHVVDKEDASSLQNSAHPSPHTLTDFATLSTESSCSASSSSPSFSFGIDAPVPAARSAETTGAGSPDMRHSTTLTRNDQLCALGTGSQVRKSPTRGSPQSSLSNDPAEVLLDINSELLRVNQEFHARNLAQTMPSELNMYITRFQSNITWMIQHTQAFQTMTIPGSQISLPTLTPPPSVSFTSTDRLQALYAHLPSLFSKQLSREQRKRQIQEVLSSPEWSGQSSSAKSPSGIQSPSRRSHDAMEFELPSNLDASISMEVNKNGKRPRTEEDEGNLGSETPSPNASVSSPPASGSGNGGSHYKRISIGGGTRRRPMSTSSSSSLSIPAMRVSPPSSSDTGSSSPEGNNATVRHRGEREDMDIGSPMYVTSSGGDRSMGPPPVPAKAFGTATEVKRVQNLGYGEEHPRTPQSPSNQASTQPIQTDNPSRSQTDSIPSPSSSSMNHQAPSPPPRSDTRFAQDVFSALPLDIRERPGPPRNLIPTLLSMIQDSTHKEVPSTFNGTGYMVDRSKGNISVQLLRSRVKDFDALPTGKKIDLLWTFQRNQLALYKKVLRSREMEREIQGKEAAKRSGGSSLLAHETVYVADGSGAERVYINGVRQPQQEQPQRALADPTMPPAAVPLNSRHTTGRGGGLEASPAPSTSSNSSLERTHFGAPTAPSSTGNATSPPSTLDAGTPSALAPSTGSTPVPSHSTSAIIPSNPLASISTPPNIPSPSWDWSTLFDANRAMPSSLAAPPSTSSRNLEGGDGIDPLAFLLAASDPSATSPANTIGSSRTVPTPQEIQMQIQRERQQNQPQMAVSPLSMVASPTFVDGLSPAPSMSAVSPTNLMGYPAGPGVGLEGSVSSFFGASPTTTLVDSPAALLSGGLSPWNPSPSDSTISQMTFVDGAPPATDYLLW